MTLSLQHTAFAHCKVMSSSIHPLSNPHETHQSMSESASSHSPPFPCLRMGTIIHEDSVRPYATYPLTVGHALPAHVFSIASTSRPLFNMSPSSGLPRLLNYRVGAAVAPWSLPSRIHATQLGANYNHAFHPSSNGRYRHYIAPARPRHGCNVELPSTTIRNHVNILKNTLRMDKDEENPGSYLLAFSFDADLAGSLHVCFLAIADTDCSITPWLPNIFEPMQVSFDKGYGQEFKQAAGTGIYLDAFDPKLVEEEGPDMVCPLVICAHTVPEKVHKGTVGGMDERRQFVNAQLTQAALKKKENGHCDVRVLRQIILVDGVRYELHDLYGAENATGKAKSLDNYSEIACVVCLSEPREIAVMPCRHMCMCSRCAAMLTSKMGRCPMCRQHVEALLRIKGGS